MALGAVLGAALAAGLPTRSKALWIDGVDVLKATDYGVPIESIVVTEMGGDQPSTMSFDVDDAAGVLSINGWQWVQFWDLTRDIPIFTGFLGSYSVSALGIGRRFSVDCIGIETVLDWVQVVPETGITIAHMPDAIRHVMAQAYGIGVPLYAASKVDTANVTYPMGTNSNDNYPQDASVSGTLRQAILSLLTDTPDGPYGYMVDFYGRLWTWQWQGVSANVTGFPFRDIAAPLYASELTYQVTVESPMAVIVDGTGYRGRVRAAGTRIGSVDRVSDDSVTDAYTADRVGTQYLRSHGSEINGTFKLEAWDNPSTPASMIHAGISVFILRESQTVGADPLYGVSSRITKTFNASGTEEWRVDFGLLFSGSRLLRSLTA